MATHKLVSDDSHFADIFPSDLEDFEIQPLFAQIAFRLADDSQCLSIPELSKSQFDWPNATYGRMQPALRLATLFLKLALPELLRIFHSSIDENPSECGHTRRSLLDPYLVRASHLKAFNEDVLQDMSSTYCFTFFGGDVFFPSAARTTVMKHGGNAQQMPSLAPVYARTALSAEWDLCLMRMDWDIIPMAEKYGKLFLLATTLIQELAHAVWIDGVASEMSADEIELAEDGERTLAPEPAFDLDDLTHVPNLGYGVSWNLFAGVPALPYEGTWSAGEMPFGEGSSFRIPLVIADDAGWVIAVNKISRHSIWRFFEPEQNPLWVPFEYGENGPELELDLLPND
jgi:hypothetical protein